MGITLNEIGDLLARFGNQIVNEQVNLACPFVGNGHIQKIKHTHEKGIVRVRAQDGLQSTGQIADGAQLPLGDNVSFVAGSYLPKIFFTRLSIPRGAAHLADGASDGVRLVREELDAAGRQLGKLLGKSVFRAPICNILNADSAIAGNTATDTAGTGIIPATAAGFLPTSAVTGDMFLVNTVAGLFEGQFLQLKDGAGVLYRAQITAISYQANIIPGDIVGATAADVAITYAIGAATATSFAIKAVVTDPSTLGGNVSGAGVALTGELVGGTSVLENQFYSGGTAPVGLPALTAAAPMVSLADAAGSADLYNMTVPGQVMPDVFKGNTITQGGALTADSMRTMSTTIKCRCGYGWKMLVMNSLVMQRYFADIIANNDALNYLPGETTKDIDGGATTAMFQGMPIVIDENVDDHVMYFFNGDDVKLAEFKDFSTDADGGAASHGMVDRNAFIYDTQIWGMYNVRVTRRNSQGMINGINA